MFPWYVLRQNKGKHALAPSIFSKCGPFPQITLWGLGTYEPSEIAM